MISTFDARIETLEREIASRASVTETTCHSLHMPGSVQDSVPPAPLPDATCDRLGWMISDQAELWKMYTGFGIVVCKPILIGERGRRWVGGKGKGEGDGTR